MPVNEIVDCVDVGMNRFEPVNFANNLSSNKFLS